MMKTFFMIILGILMVLPGPAIFAEDEDTYGEQPQAEETPEESPPEEAPPEEETVSEQQPVVLPEDTGVPPLIGPRKISIDAVTMVKYAFTDGDSYSIKYHINMGGQVNGDNGVIKGNAKVATDISGYLAKTSAFECVLKVSIADVPYEIMYRKITDNEADIDVSFKGQLSEDWESLCTFLDTPGANFNTRGAPERWISLALEKAKPSLSKLSTPIDPTKSTTMKFSIPRHTVEDEGLGNAEVEGTGVVTVEPSTIQTGETLSSD